MMYLIPALFFALSIFLALPGEGLAQPATARLAQMRAARVVRTRNEIVLHHLARAGIPYQTGDEGLPVTIEVSGRALPVLAIHVRNLGTGSGETGDEAHEIVIETGAGMLVL